MFSGKKVAVIVPAYNESRHIGTVIETMPDFVDRIIVVDDTSTDATPEIVGAYQAKMPQRVLHLRHQKNRGVGAAIISGYKKALDEEMDVVAVMAGDAQMSPQELKSIVGPVVSGKTDYAKGNRLLNKNVWEVMPRIRFFAGIVLSGLTKVVSGYWHIIDSQCGFTAISAQALREIDLDKIYERYGFPNALLVELNIASKRVQNVPITPIYHAGGKSGIKYEKIIFTLSYLLWRLFLMRLWEKYVVRGLHPLLLFYFFGGICLLSGTLIGLAIYFVQGYISLTMVIFCAILLLSGLQLVLFAMLFDMEGNKDLYVQ